MRWSKTLIPTQREEPQEAEIASHRLMLRAGLMRKLASGLYSFLPLGFKVLKKVERIVREEMDRAGALEILMPILQPREIWERSGRWTLMDEIMLKANSRQGRELVMGPTHEEVVTDLVAREISSYKQLPKNLYQIAPKFRDEIRPRFGIIRSREFLMKDAYSFDLDDESAEESYRIMYDAYIRIFERCGLTVTVVEADTGVMGGSLSHEFMVPADSGEDAVASCPACGYAANVERAERRPFPENAPRTQEKIQIIDTPELRTVEELTEFFRAAPDRFIKTLIYLGDGRPMAVLIRGDREVNESKLQRLAGVNQLELADEKTIEKVTGAPLGFAGPVGLKDVAMIADYSVSRIADGITGANQKDKHIIHVNLDRDCEIEAYHDLAIAREGDLCPRCGSPLSMSRGIEVGHVFKLGTKYSESMGALIKDEKGGSKPAVMGCYGIGISRTVAAIIEQHHDEKGIIWPAAVAPYQVLIVSVSPEDERIADTASGLYEELLARGVEVLYDDRSASAGVKFNDSDLIGIPLRITVGKKFLETGEVELKKRGSDRVQTFPPSKVPAQIENLLSTPG